jgi:anti-sigma regulatory factor (Ser/Thr protein kinase)
MSLWSKRFSGGPSAVRKARLAVREQLGETLSPERLDDVELLISELATNSVRHGACDDRADLEVETDVSERSVTLRLCDHGPGFEPGTPEPRPDGEGGYGLVLLETLSDRWGTARNGGFCVWFEVERQRDHSLVR